MGAGLKQRTPRRRRIGSCIQPDKMCGEIVKAYVIPAPGYKPSPELATELQEHVKKVTAAYKYPREIEFVDTLPKTIFRQNT